MIIEDNRPTLEFGKLNTGDCFVFNNDYYIKIGVSGTRNNAFNLSQNYKADFDSSELVAHVNAKLVICTDKCENNDEESNLLCECCELRTVCCYVKECDSEELKEKRLNFQRQLLEDYRNAKKNRGNEET